MLGKTMKIAGTPPDDAGREVLAHVAAVYQYLADLRAIVNAHNGPTRTPKGNSVSVRSTAPNRNSLSNPKWRPSTQKSGIA